MAFWDASAVVPLCCYQPATGSLRRLVNRDPRLVVWWGTPVEVRSALARLVGEGILSKEDLGRALDRLAVLRRSWTEVQPTEHVRGLAEMLPEQRGLRAADAFHLAAALVWCNERPRRRPFVCFDQRLADAAKAAGFTVVRSTRRAGLPLAGSPPAGKARPR